MLGRNEGQDFEQNCAACHGAGAKGHGEALYAIPRIKPPDLTKLTKNNGGVLPAEQVYRAIGSPAPQGRAIPFL
jgi:hypothetical protein